MEPMTLQMASDGELSTWLRAEPRGYPQFRRLANAYGQRFRINDRVAITEFATVINFDRETGKTLNHEFRGQPGVPTGAASDDTDLLKVAKLPFRDRHFVQKDFFRCPAKCGRARYRAPRAAARRFPFA